ncbi:hypothetical protein RCL1_007625 [Eukaryota sp. TZLM3-RCL]
MFLFSIQLISTLLVLSLSIAKPLFHVSPPAKTWLNDPVGTIFHNNEFHLFYQWNPESTSWAKPYWAHVSSRDLVNWTWLSVALSPDTPLETNGVWSGSAWKNPFTDQVLLFYTAARDTIIQSQCFAVNTDDSLISFEKSNSNPVLDYDSKPPYSNPAFRDPQVVLKNNTDLYMFLSGGDVFSKGNVMKYKSVENNFKENTFNFKFDGFLLQGHDVETSFDLKTNWECPVLIQYSQEVYGLLISVEDTIPGKSFIILGTVDNDYQFSPSFGVFLFDGGDVYAPRTFEGVNQSLLIGWVKEGRSESLDFSGLMTFPRISVLCDSVSDYVEYRSFVQPFLSPCYRPHNNINLLRKGSQSNLIVPGFVRLLDTLMYGEVLIESLSPVSSSDFLELSIFASRDLSEETLIKFDFRLGVVSINRTRSSLSSNQFTEIQSAPILFSASRKLSVNFLIDYTVAEVFINNRSVITTRVYPILFSQNVFVKRNTMALNVTSWKFS